MAIQNKSICLYYCGWINPPHDKIALVICSNRRWVFWFNSRAAFHGIGQLACGPADHPACLTKQCYLDLSGLKEMSEAEVNAAKGRGLITDAFRIRIHEALSQPIRRLPAAHRAVALTNLS